jgi:carbon monoxide dehydrogenase subunit G
MTNVIGDLTVSVERTLDVDGETVFDVLADPETLGDVERVAREERRESTGRAGATGAGVRDPPPQLHRGDTFVGSVAVPGGRDADRVPDVGDGVGTGASFESYFTVEEHDAGRLVLSGGGDGDAGSFDARVVVAVADVPDGAVVRVDATMDVAGRVASLGAQRVRAAAAAVLERYLSRVDRAAASPA